ncbi:MAG TPA: DNA-formamidopyrimidine glycosylase family protein [Actinocatenispora sp.]
MPELPEVAALAAYLTERAAGHVVDRADAAAFSAMKTYDPPLSTVVGRTVTGAGRHGKFLDIGVDGGLHLIVHFSRAGWLHYRDALPPAPPRPGKGPIALRVRLDDGSGFDLTEAGTQKRLAVYLVTDPAQVPGIARLGPDPLTLSLDEFATVLAGRRNQVKGVLTDQTVLAGIGNAYSDEILHAAKLSPFALAGKLSDEEVGRLYEATRGVLGAAMERAVGQKAATLKGEKRSGLAVHGRAGLPCPVCGDTVRTVSFSDSSLQYCPTCQTSGRPLADRRMSKLLK